MKEDGSRGVQFVRIEAFVPASNGLGVYGYIRKGKMASVSGSICTSTYPDKKTGETIFRQALSAHMVTLLDNVSNKKMWERRTGVPGGHKAKT